MITLAWTPFSGLGLYGGFRGNRWLRNRIKIYKQFVIPSLLNQTDKDFVIWISWRREERDNKYVKELETWLRANTPFKIVFTFGGLPMWDDKYPDDEARVRLATALHNTLPDLMEVVGDAEEVYVLLVPSDDLYDKSTVESVKKTFKDTDLEAVGFKHGYICNYHTKEVLEYNPNTNPPFFAVRYPKNIFFDPAKHMAYISTKQDQGKYPKGTPYPSHEWVPNAFKMGYFQTLDKSDFFRGFMVGTHGENISTHFNHPFGGAKVDKEILKNFGIFEVPPLDLPRSIRKAVLRKLPHKWQKRLRFLFGERIFSRIYNFLRN